MKHATLSPRDRALLEEVRELLRSVAAAMSLDVEEQLAALERRLVERIDQRRTVVIRRPTNGARLVARVASPPTHRASPALDPDPDPSGQGRGAPTPRGLR